jgi:hypothetical protein
MADAAPTDGTRTRRDPLSLDTCGRPCVRVTPRSASSNATGFEVIALPRSAWMVSRPGVVPVFGVVSGEERLAQGPRGLDGVESVGELWSVLERLEVRLREGVVGGALPYLGVGGGGAGTIRRAAAVLPLTFATIGASGARSFAAGLGRRGAFDLLAYAIPETPFSALYSNFGGARCLTIIGTEGRAV